jgi:protein-tyrosine-phosphatase
MKSKISILLTVSILMISIACNNRSVNKDKSTKQSEKKQFEGSDAELLPAIEQYIADIENDFVNIAEERKTQLKRLALYINTKSSSGEPANLIFICTHNSRRSHMSQIWAQSAAYHYGVKNVYTFSGGTEATAFNHRSVRALRKAGFEIDQADSSANPVYMVRYAKDEKPIKCFSKKYDDESNPRENFVAIMTCSEADKTCPQVSGATLRIAIPYADPKEADGTPEEEKRYDERCRQIATEVFYIFSQIKTN